MAVATLVSRAAGFARVLVVASALGLGSRLLDAYNVANTLPNAVFEIVVGGAMASVVVPLLARSSHAGDAQRLLSLTVYGLSAITIAAMVTAPWIVSLYTPGFSADQRSTAVLFARFFLPQIPFYGVSAVAGAILNTRGRFAAPAWAPLINSVVVIAVGLLYLAVPSFTLLAAGTTAGVFAQMALVVWALRRSGFPLRLRFDLRGLGLRRIARLGGWALLSVAAAQVLLAVATRAASLSGPGGVSVYQNASAIFQVPYAVIALSVMTAILPRLSRNAARHDLRRVTDDLSRAIRLAVVILAPVAAAMLVLGPQIATLLFAHGNSSPSAVTRLGLVVAAFGVALVPFTAYAILQRGFYALQDTRTPALITTGVTAVGVPGCLVAGWTLPSAQVVVAVPLAYAVAYTTGLIASAIVLRRRLGRLDGHRLLRTHAKVAVATGAAGVVTALLSDSLPVALISAAVLFLAIAELLHLTEIRQLYRMTGMSFLRA
ncbi:murein biosynthesis integral membrane protein MurJ [Paractinoplanes atraurantiacus]|uniref:Putative peptidoglycan lipid II flippase n=1 Tax=Paractinoplanes atraurantiacus TaxID=1036182 RepID=A0A285ID76_9ACTN|nr:murein biosynthesis integral membrane protein MurJ [Actinoplanes atraurantiacus]SNY45938.1 putative peptidoglycan lipid II flippase [Actinoplanes atraurantiacus]